MLNGTLTLHDIQDVEAFAAAILHRRGLTPTEDLLAYLVEEAWKLSRRYDPRTGSRFSAWAKLTLERRLIDIARQHDDHRYSSRRPTLVHLDDPLAASLPGSDLDDPAHSDPDLQRILEGGVDPHHWHVEQRDRHTPPRAA